MKLLHRCGCALFVSSIASCASGPLEGDANGGGGTNLDAQPALPQPPVCAEYLKCAATLSAQQVPAGLAEIESDGACWKSEAQAAKCTQTCETGLSHLRESFPDCGVAGQPDACANVPATGDLPCEVFDVLEA